jgi:large subunit ribosomal protein L13
MNYTIDAKNKRLGHLASEIAVLLQGKRQPSYRPNAVAPVKVLVSNVDKIEISGTKATQKIYYRHTGYMGHLKEKTYEQEFAKDPKKVVREAVRRMLPKNFLNQKRLNNLVFVESE